MKTKNRDNFWDALPHLVYSFVKRLFVIYVPNVNDLPAHFQFCQSLFLHCWVAFDFCFQDL
jgi:hypothetical protein